MKYFLDTEFLEGEQDIRVLGFKTEHIGFLMDWAFLWFGIYICLWHSPLFGGVIIILAVLFLKSGNRDKTAKTIDLISIGIVGEDGRKYYAISNEFNLDEAWNRYDKKLNKNFPLGPAYIKNYWLRKNVLMPIFADLNQREREMAHEFKVTEGKTIKVNNKFTKRNLRRLIKKYGLSNSQMQLEIKQFVDYDGRSVIMSEDGFNKIVYSFDSKEVQGFRDEFPGYIEIKHGPPEFYAYYADYDWVVFCWIFGKMIELPETFPMFCRDLQQTMTDLVDEIWEAGQYSDKTHVTSFNHRQLDIDTNRPATKRDYMRAIKKQPDYPANTNEHDALADAKWNYELYKFLRDF